MKVSSKPYAAVAGGEHSIIRTRSGGVVSAGACGLGWCRGEKLTEALFGWRRVVFPEPIRSVHASYYHNLSISENGTLWSWGCGTFIDGNNDGIIPALGSAQSEDRGGQPQVVPGIQGRAVSLSGGAYHSVVLNETGLVYTFGAGQLGQLGRSLTNVTTVDGAGLPVDPHPQPVEGIDASEEVTDIGASFYNTLVSCKSGALYCSGENQNLQCGLANGQKNLHRMERVEELIDTHIVKSRGGYCHNLMLDDEGNVIAMGCGDEGNRGDGISEEEHDMKGGRPTSNYVTLPCPAKDIACGANHSLILGVDGHVYSFGSDEYGQLGHAQGGGGNRGKEEEEDEENVVLSPRRVILPLAGNVVSISAGYAHTTITDCSGLVFMFGNNDSGQLGLNTSDISFTTHPTKAYDCDLDELNVKL